MTGEVIKGYAKLLAEIKARVRAAQYEALRAVNKELVALYWDIGRMIVERQQGGAWGKSIVERLAADLQNEFPGMQGFSVQNLWYMRQFYLAALDARHRHAGRTRARLRTHLANLRNSATTSRAVCRAPASCASSR